VLGYLGDANLRVTGGQLRRLRVQAPSVVKAGEAFPVDVVPMDEWSSAAKNPSGLKLKMRSTDVRGGGFAWDETLQHYVAREGGGRPARCGSRWNGRRAIPRHVELVWVESDRAPHVLR
jgi:hypothetical protein